eukprot:PhM_4_TR12422/c0_g1_i1/m.86821
MSWHLVANSPDDFAGDHRKHKEIEGRIVTILAHKGKVHCLDTVCYHAGGPLGRGPITDIEDLDTACIRCTWHSYCVALETGERVYQSCDMVGGKLVPGGWKKGPKQQRVHDVDVRPDGVYIRINTDSEELGSDQYAACVDARKYMLAQKMLSSSAGNSNVPIHSGMVLKQQSEQNFK